MFRGETELTKFADIECQSHPPAPYLSPITIWNTICPMKKNLSVTNQLSCHKLKHKTNNPIRLSGIKTGIWQDRRLCFTPFVYPHPPFTGLCTPISLWIKPRWLSSVTDGRGHLTPKHHKNKTGPSHRFPNNSQQTDGDASLRHICLSRALWPGHKWTNLEHRDGKLFTTTHRYSQSGLGIISCAAATEAAALVIVMTLLECSDVKI